MAKIIDTERFLELFQAKLDEIKNTPVAGHSHADFLWSMFAHMCKVRKARRNLGIYLTISPFGIASHLDKNLNTILVDDFDYELRVKRTIVRALENLIFMRTNQLKQIKKDMG